MRKISSCTLCRSRKKRCITTMGGPCQLCMEKGLVCDAPITPPDTASMPHVGDELVSPGENQISHSIVEEALADLDLGEGLIHIYFRVVHTAQHLLFHPATFVQEYRDGLLPPFLLLGVFAVAARFSNDARFDHIKPSARGNDFLREAIKSFYDRQDLISIPALQGSVLLSFAAFVQGDADQDAMLNCQGVRIAQMLRLPVSASPNLLGREIEINLYWQTWMMERWTYVRAQNPLQMSASLDIPKPLREDLFDEMSLDTTLEPPRCPSIWGLLVPLTEWYAEVLKLNCEIAHEPAFNFRVGYLVRDLSSKLERWAQNIPESLKNTPENWSQNTRRGYGQRFAVLHIIYHHTCQLLFYQFLNKNTASEAPNEEAATNSELCKAHATAVSKIMWELNVSTRLNCLWSPLNGHILVVASTVHLHTVLLQVDKPEAIEAKELLEQNFIILQQLQKYWSTAEISISRLQAFHNACRMSSLSETFNMDKWMVLFLNRHDLLVEDREVNLDDVCMKDSETEVWNILSGHVLN